MSEQGPSQHVFLERRSYRQRRMMDGLRLLPILGLMLWTLPVFWPVGDTPDTTPVMLSEAIIYVFSVWVLLIIASLVLWRVLRDGLAEDVDPGTDEGG